VSTQLVAGDTGTILKVVCKDESGEVLPGLASATVKLKYRIGASELQTRTMQVADAQAGRVEYQFQTDELVAGQFKGEVEVTDAANKVLTNLNPIVLSIRKRV